VVTPHSGGRGIFFFSPEGILMLWIWFPQFTIRVWCSKETWTSEKEASLHFSV
jgi:hypothetical protein